jgi:hypothetical protein
MSATRRSFSVNTLRLTLALTPFFACATPKLPAQTPTSQAQLPSAPSATGTITGSVTDGSGAAVRDAVILLTHGSASHAAAPRETTTDGEGHFAFTHVTAGDITLVAESPGLAPQSITATLSPGGIFQAPAFVLPIATANSDISVSLTQEEIAEADVKAEEKQRVLGVIPNYFVVYDHSAPPLTRKQKFNLGLHEQFDPVSIGIDAVVAGVEQAANSFPGYHQGLEGYGRRFGATLGDSGSDTLLRHAVYASLFHQDPRYFYNGKGTITHRALYALSTAFISKGDNGQWQPAYASLAGNLSSGALSNLYYPAGNRRNAATTVYTGLLRTAGVGFGHLAQEFLFKHVSSGTSKNTP